MKLSAAAVLFIDRLKDSNEFFIAKAIGWILREYPKTDPIEVENYVKNHSLKASQHTRGIKSH
jgi:3-methyladenine DNA glycosylase AlkD